MISINDLNVSFGSRNVLSGLTLQMEEEKIHGIVGYNGAGKTTLLNAIYGVKKRHACIQYKQRPIDRADIGYLEMEPFFYSGITGRDYLEVFQHQGRFNDYISLCDMFNVPIDNYVDAYSSGTKKKLSIIAVLLTDKEILLLDEPFNGLDIESVAILQLILKKLKQSGKTIVVTSHIMESLMPVCDDISLLQDGRIKKTYLPDEYQHLSNEFMKTIEKRFDTTLNDIFQSI